MKKKVPITSSNGVATSFCQMEAWEEKDDFVEDEAPIRRYTVYPIDYPDLWKMYKTHVAAFWTPEEIDLGADIVDWQESLTPQEKYFLSHVLAFFAASDGLVVENLALRFMKDTTKQEALAFYGFQIAMENIHAETYSLLIDTYIRDPDQKRHLFDGINEIPSIRAKAEWTLRWTGSSASYAERLIGFACVEGILFSSSFAAIFWFKQRRFLPGLCYSNELISRDEGLHRNFACLMYGYEEPLPEERVREIVFEAVMLEKRFAQEALSVPLLGMNETLMSEYIEVVADHLLMTLGLEPEFDTPNPFPFMEMISVSGKTNFFERRTSEYQRAGEFLFSLEEDF